MFKGIRYEKYITLQMYFSKVIAEVATLYIEDAA